MNELSATSISYPFSLENTFESSALQINKDFDNSDRLAEDYKQLSFSIPYQQQKPHLQIKNNTTRASPMLKDDLHEQMATLKSWKEHSDTQQISQVLKRLMITKIPDMGSLEQLSQSVLNFHRDICKSDGIDEEWFQLTGKVKKYVRKAESDLRKQKSKKLELVKKHSQVINYPPTLLQGKSQAEEQILKYLYKSFISNFEAKELSVKIVPFIHNVYVCLEEEFGVKSKEIRSRIDKIGQNLDRSSASSVKLEMLDGLKTPKQVADNDDEVYIDQIQKQKQIQVMRQQQKASETGFYQEMKTLINKNASEQCRFCHKLAAYCQDQKQTRASDQPMTRFMICNKCGRRWRD